MKRSHLAKPYVSVHRGVLNGRIISALAAALRAGLRAKVCVDTQLLDWAGQLRPEPEPVAALTRDFLLAQPGLTALHVQRIEEWLADHKMKLKPAEDGESSDGVKERGPVTDI